MLGTPAVVADVIVAPCRLERCRGTAEFIDQRRNTSDGPPSTVWCSKRDRRADSVTAAPDKASPSKDIAAVIGRRLNLPVVSKVREEAKERFGWFAHFARIDNRASSGCDL